VETLIVLTRVGAELDIHLASGIVEVQVKGFGHDNTHLMCRELLLTVVYSTFFH